MKKTIVRATVATALALGVTAGAAGTAFAATPAAPVPSPRDACVAAVQAQLKADITKNPAGTVRYALAAARQATYCATLPSTAPKPTTPAPTNPAPTAPKPSTPQLPAGGADQSAAN
ncbi:MAG: hypothetical protein ABW212_16545 [Pseudonocardia sediminis]